MRKNDHNVNALITSKDNEEKDLYFYHKRSAINTISKDLAEKRENKPKKNKKIKRNIYKYINRTLSFSK